MPNIKRLIYKIRAANYVALSVVAIILSVVLICGSDTARTYAAPATTPATTDANTLCADGSPAPNGDTSKCTVCADGSTAPDNDPSKCAYCSDNSAAPGGDVSNCFQGAAVGSVCGAGANATKLSINIGCKGEGNPIADAAFAIIRLLSDGVGLVIIASIIVAGIQYSASRGDPQSTAKAIKRIQSTLMALLIFIFGYAILNYIIPNSFLK
jgi:hypothetical protein